ncbi:MAG: hypothetical protein ACE5HJ_05855 [Thermoplasmata archaeon]
MVARQVAAALATVGIIIGLVLLLLALDILLPVIIFLGVALFLLIVVALAVFALLSILLIPYYFFTKRPKVEPGSYRLEDVEEK